jgi:hypothetical protein
MIHFNVTIQQLSISEVDLSDRLYTWSNKQSNPILARLDRVFSNNELNLSFPLATLSSLPRPTSDHTPLLLSLSTSLPKAGFFRFEKFWLHNQSFLPSVLPTWEQAPVRDDAVGQLAACIKLTRSAAKVWSRRIRAPPFLIRNSQFLVQLFDYFEETRPLSSEEFQVRANAQSTLQRAIQAQAAYFIRLVRVNGSDIVNHDGKTAALTEFFKGIIGTPGSSEQIDLVGLV